ncbi:unnamed protein product [Effrenium voratum]|nr:unnamed protein product [Effrenium voratum]
MTKGHWCPPRLCGRNESLVEAVNDWHFAMLNDSHRNQFYWDALAACCKGKRVIDIGAGSGLLSLMAAKLGAESVLAIEASKDMLDLATLNAQRNGQADKIKIIHGMSSKVHLDDASKADVIVSETLGALMLGEGLRGGPGGSTEVVVPRTHRDGTFELLGGCKSARSVGHLAQRAVQLDVRPTSEQPHESAFIAWDSRLVHQGHTYAPGAAGWNPPLKVPAFFTADNPGWKVFLQEEGYVVLTDVLQSGDVKEALRLLLQDLKLLQPKLQSLDQVREQHLPSNKAGNDLRMSAGLSHGAFAWYLRCHPEVSRLFEQLFDLPGGSPLVGSVDVVALAPPCSSSFYGKQWLHLDYTPPQGRICQACLQLFPQSWELGARWERIALMVCKAPAAWASPRAGVALLAACVAGVASRATAGVTRGKLHREDPERPDRRLLPQLANQPLASDAEAGAFDVRRLKPKELLQRFSEEQLRKLLPKTQAKYVSPQPRLTRAKPPPALSTSGKSNAMAVEAAVAAMNALERHAPRTLSAVASRLPWLRAAPEQSIPSFPEAAAEVLEAEASVAGVVLEAEAVEALEMDGSVLPNAEADYTFAMGSPLTSGIMGGATRGFFGPELLALQQRSPLLGAVGQVALLGFGSLVASGPCASLSSAWGRVMTSVPGGSHWLAQSVQWMVGSHLGHHLGQWLRGTESQVEPRPAQAGEFNIYLSEMCVICNGEFGLGDFRVGALNCGHACLCRDNGCLEQWQTQGNRSCPVCQHQNAYVVCGVIG